MRMGNGERGAGNGRRNGEGDRLSGGPPRMTRARSAGGVACASSPGFGASPEVACKPGPVPSRRCRRAGEDHSSRRRIAAPLEHSYPCTGTPRSASGGPPSTVRLFELAPGGACPAAGHPAVARGLLPHDFKLACASTPVASQPPALRRPSALWFLLRFPSGHPGSPLTTSLPFGARTFLPRAVRARRRSSVHLRHGESLACAPACGRGAGARAPGGAIPSPAALARARRPETAGPWPKCALRVTFR